MPTTTALTGIVRAPEPSGDTLPRPIPLSTSLRALPGVPSDLVVCAGHPEPCPAATGGSGFTIEIGSDSVIGPTELAFVEATDDKRFKEGGVYRLLHNQINLGDFQRAIRAAEQYTDKKSTSFFR